MNSVNQTKKREFVKGSSAAMMNEIDEAWDNFINGKISLPVYKALTSKCNLKIRNANLIRLENRTRGEDLLENPFFEQTK